MEGSGSSSHQVTAKETMGLDEDPCPKPAYTELVIALMNPPL